MMTSSPGKTKAWMAVKIAWVAPAVIKTSWPHIERPYCLVTRLQIFSRKVGKPCNGAY